MANAAKEYAKVMRWVRQLVKDYREADVREDADIHSIVDTARDMIYFLRAWINERNSSADTRCYAAREYEVVKDKGEFCLRCGWQEFRGGQEHGLRKVVIDVSDKGHDGSLAGEWVMCDDCLVAMHSWFGL